MRRKTFSEDMPAPPLASTGRRHRASTGFERRSTATCRKGHRQGALAKLVLSPLDRRLISRAMIISVRCR